MKDIDMEATKTVPGATGHPFFDLNADYYIDPGAGDDDLVEDALCLIASGLGVFETISEAIMSRPNSDEGNAYWAGVYMLRQAKAVLMQASGTKELEPTARVNQVQPTQPPAVGPTEIGKAVCSMRTLATTEGPGAPRTFTAKRVDLVFTAALEVGAIANTLLTHINATDRSGLIAPLARGMLMRIHALTEATAEIVCEGDGWSDGQLARIIEGSSGDGAALGLPR